MAGRNRLVRLLAMALMVPLMVLSLLFGSGVPSAQAAGTAQLLVTVVAVDSASGAPITSLTSSQSPRRIGFRVDFSCVSAACDSATVKFDPTQLDPNYNFYRLLRQTGFTPPLSGGSLAGSETAGYTVALGNLSAGASGQFTLEYGWQDLGQSGYTPERQDSAYAIFPDGFEITQAVRGNATTAVGEQTATTTPVIWHIPTPDPTISTNIQAPASGFFSTDTDITYQLRMSTGCKNEANRFTYDFQCSSAYTVTHQLPPGAELVSAPGSYTKTGSAATGWLLTWVGPPWANTGDTSLVGWAANPHTITITFPRANVAPAGQPCNFTTQFNGPTGRVDATYISLPATPGVQKFATLAPSGPFQLKCSDPFPRAAMDPKQSTYDGAGRALTADATVVVPATGVNLKEWRVTTYNTANIPGVAVVTDNTLDQPDLPVYQIVALAGSTIVWTATDGTTTVSGTSTGTADAPAGFRFATSKVTSPSLAPPNTIPEQTFRTAFTVRYLYKVSPSAPGGARRTNTASAVMQWPGHPEFPDTVLGPTTGTVVLIAPFGRIAAWKGGYTSNDSSQTLGGNNNDHPSGTVDLPIPTSNKSFWWNVWAVNSGNAPAIATITDTTLNDPELPITSLQPLTWSSAGGCCIHISANIQYTLDDGTTGTASNVTVYNAPAGRRIASFTATTVNPITGGSTTPADGGWNSFVMTLGGTLGPNATPDSSHANTFTGSLDYQNPSVPNLTAGNTFTVHLVGPNPVLTATMGNPTIAGGASKATTTTDVTFTVGGTTAQVPLTRDITPEYVFMAPVGWNITPGSAKFPAGSVPAGVQFTYRTVTVAGVPRQVAVASWPAGTAWGKNMTLPVMSVVARPTAAAPLGTNVARGFIANTNTVKSGDTFTNQFTDTPDLDGNPATTRFSEANPPASVSVGSVAAMQVLKEICLPDASQPDGCKWYSDPNNAVGVPPNSTSIKYRISVTNTGNTPLSDVVGYDILPYVGDTGTSTATLSTPRGSTFQETVASVTGPTNGATATFSTSTQPCRAEVATVPGCVSGWGTTSSGAQAIKVVRPGVLAAGDSFSMQYTGAVINAPGFGAKASNSFAVKATGLSNVSEPAPVTATIEETDLAVVAGTPQLQKGRPGVLPWTVTNHGGAPFTTGEVKVAIPAGLEVTSFSPTGWTCTAVDGNGTPVFGTAIGPAVLTCTPTAQLAKGVPQALDIPVRPTTTGALTMTADVSGLLFDGNMPNNDDDMSVKPTAAAGDVGVMKTDGVTTARPGDVLTYTITVDNPLDFETLTGATLTDTLPSRVTFVSASDGGTESGGVVTWALPNMPGQGSLTRTVTVRVSSTINTAELVNTARVSAPDPANPGKPLTGTAEDRDTVVTRPEITLVKGSEQPTYAAVGDVVTYTFAIRNTGDVTLTDIDISDELEDVFDIQLTWPPGSTGLLAPGVPMTATAKYTITQADIDAGRVLNTATVSGKPPAGKKVTDTDSHTVTSTAVPHVTLTKTSQSTPARAGDVVTYSFVLVNDGPITLQNVAIADPLPGLTGWNFTWGPSGPNVLAPGEKVTATATYRVTQAAVDAGQVVNTATGSGRTPTGTPVSDDDTFTIPITRAPAIAFDKDGEYTPGERGEAGETINYTFTATNTGNVTLTGVVVTDPLPGLSDKEYHWPGVVGVLAPGQAVVVNASYTVTQADVDGAGEVTNTATVDGMGPGDVPVHGEDTVTLQTPVDAGIQIVKTGRIEGDAPVQAGDIVRYRFEVTNLGVLTLHGVELDDVMVGLSDIDLTWPGVENVLKPGATLVGTASYTLTQADVDAGKVVNTATTKGITPGDETVTDDDTLTLVIPAAPAITLDKDGKYTPGERGEAGDTINYTFTATNTGNVTLTGVVVTDPMPGLSDKEYRWPGVAGVLAPGQAVVGTASYTVTQADVDGTGEVTNTATVDGTGPAGTPVHGEDTVTLQTPADAGIQIVKTGRIEGDAPVQAGDVVRYRFEVTNLGVVTLGEVGLDDRMVGLSDIDLTWPGEENVLKPGATLVGTASYTLTQADVDAGKVVNTATTRGTPPRQGEPVTDDDTLTLVIPAAPAITLDKDGKYTPGERGKAGDIIHYEFTATNTGNVTLTGVVVTDPLPGLSDLAYTWPGAEGVLAPGQSVVATAKYSVTQADVDGPGEVTNTATVDGMGPGDVPVHGEDTVTLQTPVDAGIQIVKTGRIEGGAPAQAGDVVRYRFDVTNLGVLTLHGVELDDEMEGLSDIDLDWPGEEKVLKPGATLVGTASYTLTQADVDAGKVVNTATTKGITPGDEPVTDDDSLTLVISAAPAITLDKTATIKQGVWQEGDTVSYGFTITNTGNVTLQGVVVTDPMPGLSDLVYTWPGDEDRVLAPGETATATAEYQLTAADVNTGELVNTATATSDRTPDTDDSVTLTAPPVVPVVPSVSEMLDSLAHTGAGFTGVLLTAAALLVGGGLVLMVIRRRRRQERY
ncbi:hypothetical protein AB4Y63_17725 [Leifsonia sp. YAF41]|uniref:DUF7507 domain-containing protein n=1 Tax=Leifsonia sp. YAF41 TaxID=3233086 RepID=UPI003F964893